MYATYQREYENFTHLPGESIDALFQRFTVIVNNMRANVDVLPYDDHDRAVKCRPHGGMNSKTKSWTISWLSLKTKVEPGLRGSRVMSGDWRRLHRVRGVFGGSPENHWVPWLIHKAKTEEPKTVLQQLQTGLTGGSD
jgi:hypothetical protein